MGFRGRHRGSGDSSCVEPSSQYTSRYYDRVGRWAEEAAQVVVPLLADWLQPRSVCDVGCGRGTWLKAFTESGVDVVCGLDREELRGELEVPARFFVAADFETPIRLDRKFDLALSLEVAEHLSQNAAPQFVESLVRLAPVVLFSAAIPGQGGTKHLNEQWPDYWADHFGRHGYIAVDCLRPRLWHDSRVAFFYKQNMLLFVERSSLGRYPELETEYARGRGRPLAIVHPEMLTVAIERFRRRHVDPPHGSLSPPPG